MSSLPKKTRRLRIEPLEQRTLLAVDSWPGTLIHDDWGGVYSVDLDDGMALEFVDTTDEVLSDMAFSPEGKLYGVTLPAGGWPSRLYAFTTDFETPSIETDPDWPRTITLGGTQVYVNSLGFNTAGELFAVGSKFPNPHSNSNFLFKINPDTGGAEEVLALSDPSGDYHSSGDLTFDSHGNMYVTTLSGDLLRIPPEQDSFVVVGNTEEAYSYGLVFGPAPIMYAFTWWKDVYEIDMATGVSTFVTHLDDASLDYVNGAATIFPPPTDLGEVDFRGLAVQEPPLGEFWVRVEAVREALLTAEVAGVDPGAQIDVTLYEFDNDGDLDELATGLLRVDYEDTVIGGEYFVKIAGAESEFDLRLANLVQIHGVGNGAVVHGTEEDDTFTFEPGTPYNFSINEVGYQYNFGSSSMVVVSFDGGIGRDAAELTGSSGSDTATLNLAGFSGKVERSPRYRVEVSGTPEITFDGVDGDDEAILQGSDFGDTITLKPTEATVIGVNSFLHVSDVEDIDVDGAGGDDSATFTGTADPETADLRYQAADFEGSGFAVGVTNVETIAAEAGGGYDTATFADSPLQDTFEATPDWASLNGPGVSLLASGYDEVRAESTHGGNDVALLRDEVGVQNTFEATPQYGRITGTEFDNQASSFRYLHGYGTPGDLDVALLYGDPAGVDTYRAWAQKGVLSGTNYYNRARSFRYTHAYSNAGGNDVALLYGDPDTNDKYQAWSNQVVLSGPSYYYRARSFRYAHGYGNAGNQDVALLYGDPAQLETLRAWQQQVVLSSASYYNRAKSFRYAHGYGNPGGSDVAYLYGDPGAPDLFRMWGYQSVFSGPTFYNRAKSFDRLYAVAAPGAGDVAHFYLTEGADEVYQTWSDDAVLDGPGYHIEAWNFPRVEAYGNADDADKAFLHDAALTIDLLTALDNWADLTAPDGSFSSYVEDFGEVTAYSTTPGGDLRDVGTVTYILKYDGIWTDI